MANNITITKLTNGNIFVEDTDRRDYFLQPDLDVRESLDSLGAVELVYKTKIVSKFRPEEVLQVVRDDGTIIPISDLSTLLSELGEYFFFEVVADLDPIEARLDTLENAAKQITYFESIDISSSTAGTITIPTGATLNETALGAYENCVILQLDTSGDVLQEIAEDTNGDSIDSTLDSSGNWTVTNTYASSNVALVYVLSISAVDYAAWTGTEINKILDLTTPLEESFTLTDGSGTTVGVDNTSIDLGNKLSSNAIIEGGAGLLGGGYDFAIGTSTDPISEFSIYNKDADITITKDGDGIAAGNIVFTMSDDGNVTIVSTASGGLDGGSYILGYDTVLVQAQDDSAGYRYTMASSGSELSLAVTNLSGSYAGSVTVEGNSGSVNISSRYIDVDVGANSITVTSSLAGFSGLEYASDNSANFTLRSLTDKEYNDSYLGGNKLNALVITPTSTEDGYSVSWNDSSSEYELTPFALADNSVTNSKLSDMAANTIKARNNVATGDPQDMASGDVTEQTTPVAGDYLLGWDASANIKKYDVGYFLHGGIVETFKLPNLEGATNINDGDFFGFKATVPFGGYTEAEFRTRNLNLSGAQFFTVRVSLYEVSTDNLLTEGSIILNNISVDTHTITLDTPLFFDDTKECYLVVGANDNSGGGSLNVLRIIANGLNEVDTSFAFTNATGAMQSSLSGVSTSSTNIVYYIKFK